MFTRHQYVTGECSHREYYAQYDCPSLRRVVSMTIGIKRVKESSDPHLNDIPLREWDHAASLVINEVGRKNAELQAYDKPCSSLSDRVCALKECAKMMAEESKSAESVTA